MGSTTCTVKSKDMKFHVVCILALPFFAWRSVSQMTAGGIADSPHITGGRHYWEWVSACSEWAVKAQERYLCTMEGRIECKTGWKWNMCEGPMCAYLELPATFCSEPICSEGCDEKHGYCEVPDTCKFKVLPNQLRSCVFVTLVGLVSTVTYQSAKLGAPLSMVTALNQMSVCAS